MIGKLLEDAWQAEREITHRNALEGRLLDFKDLRIYAGVDPAGDRRFVAFKLDGEQQRGIKDRRPRSTRGILYQPVVDGSLLVMFLREQPGIPASVFPAVMEDVVALATSAEQPAGLRRAIDRFNSWQSAFERRSGPMSSAEVRGILGELLTLRDVLIPALGAQRAVERWTSVTPESLHDFNGTSWALEAKSVLAPASAFHVSVLGQLEPVPGIDVWLSVVELAKSEDRTDLCLREVATSLVDLMGPDAILRTSFEEALIKRGASHPSLDSELDVRYRLQALRVFQIGADFPLIRRAVVPLAVGHVEYDIDLVGCTAYEIKRLDLIEEISNRQGES